MTRKAARSRMIYVPQSVLLLLPWHHRNPSVLCISAHASNPEFFAPFRVTSHRYVPRPSSFITALTRTIWTSMMLCDSPRRVWSLVAIACPAMAGLWSTLSRSRRSGRFASGLGPWSQWTQTGWSDWHQSTSMISGLCVFRL